MQLVTAGTACTHFSYLLAALDILTLSNKDPVVMGIGTEICLVVFNNDKPTITPESTPRVHNLAICSGIYAVTFSTCYIDTFPAAAGRKA
jgi:hypothetical protein